MKTILMKTNLTKTLRLVGASLLLSASLFAQSSGEAFAKAKRLELEEAQVQKALPLYELVLQDPQAPKAMKAQALYRQSICYLKLEEYAKASDTLAHLEKTYPNSDQAVQAKLLRRSLGNGGKTLSPRRDLSFEVQELLVTGIEKLRSKGGEKTFWANLQRLRLLGPSALPALRKVLKLGEKDLKEMATIALAEQGDEAALAPLLEGLKDSSSILSYKIQRKDLIIKICKAHPKLLRRLREVFAKSSGRKKGSILELLYSLGALDKTSNPRDFLSAEDERVRRAAWGVLAKQAQTSPQKSKEYIDHLLKTWVQFPKQRKALTPFLVKALPIAERAGDPSLSSWSKFILKEANKKDLDFLYLLSREVASNYQSPVLPLRMALVQPYFELGKLYDDKRFLAPYLSPKDKTDMVFPVLTTILAQAKRSMDATPIRTLNILRSLFVTVPDLSEPLLRQFLFFVSQGNLLDKCQKKEGELGLRPIQSVFESFFRILPRSQTYQVGLPLCLDLARDKHQPWQIRMSAALGISRWVKSRMDGNPQFTTPKKTVENLLQALFEIQDHLQVPAPWTRNLKEEIFEAYRHILFHPAGLTLRQAFRRFSIPPQKPFGGPSINRVKELIAQAQKGRSRLALYLDLIQDPKVLNTNLVNWSGAFDLKPEERGKALKAIWKRLNHSLRGKIISQFPIQDQSIAFFLAQISEDPANIPVPAMRQWSQGLPTSKRPVLLSALLPIADAKTKIQICQDLESLASPVAAPALIQLLVYPDLKIRRAAESALESIRNIKKNQKAWKEWYEAMQKKEKK